MSKSKWLKKHIVEKLYLQVEGYDSFRFDFKNGLIVEERKEVKNVLCNYDAHVYL